MTVDTKHVEGEGFVGHAKQFKQAKDSVRDAAGKNILCEFTESIKECQDATMSMDRVALKEKSFNK